jgi:PadR family transcriptional regulator
MRTELRRGGLVMAVLAALREKHYGYSLRKRLLDAGIDIEEGTLYPLIRRLETQGLLESEWIESAGRKRRYYKATENGLHVLDQLRGEWSQMVLSLEQLLGGKP